MHPADHSPLNQAPSQSEGALALARQPKVEATIASLKQHFETVRQYEVKRVRGRLGELSSTQENAIESLTHRIIDLILETPITVLKAAAEEGNSLAVIKTVHRVFSLSNGSDRSGTV
jgi:glutamyl-tRNA reductase